MSLKEDHIMFLSDSKNNIFVGPIYNENKKAGNILFRYINGRAYDMVNHDTVLPIGFDNKTGNSYVRVNACFNMDGVCEKIVSRGEKVTIEKLINGFNEEIEATGNLFLKEEPRDFKRSACYTDADFTPNYGGKTK